MTYRTIDDLNSKIWYRALKVIYILFFSITYLIEILNLVLTDGAYLWVLEPVILTGIINLAIFYLLRGCFYYIVLGSFSKK